ncbi:hypothetical protein ACOME3_009359 [Neoechinorhynchus agilis]
MPRRRVPRKRNYRGEMKIANNVISTTSPVIEQPAENKRIKLQNNPVRNSNYRHHYQHTTTTSSTTTSTTTTSSHRRNVPSLRQESFMIQEPSSTGTVASSVKISIPPPPPTNKPAPAKCSTHAKEQQQQHSPRKPPKARDNGDYSLKLGEVLTSEMFKYDVLEYLGRGTFGQVVKCIRRGSSDVVAIKILKNHPSYIRQGQIEVSILNMLEREQADRCNIVKAVDIFKHRNHTCLAFELLEMNLYDYLKQSKFAPMSLRFIRPIAKQILIALIKLKQIGIVHADLKPENIMLVDPARQPYRIKVIDFGSASQTIRTIAGSYLQSRYYRAPEVLIGHSFSESIDVWSLGCVLVELFLGWPLYPGSCEYDQIRYICETQGIFPNNMLNRGSKSRRFFTHTVLSPGFVTWRLKSSDEYAAESGKVFRESRKYMLTCLDDITHANLSILNAGTSAGIRSPRGQSMNQAEVLDRGHFVDLIKTMLAIDPKMRVQPSNAVRFSFISMNHLTAHPTYLQQCHHDMEVCAADSNCPLSPRSFNADAMSAYGSFPQPLHLPVSNIPIGYNNSGYHPMPNLQQFPEVHQDNIVSNPLYWAATAAAAAAAAAACSRFPPFIAQPAALINPTVNPFDVTKFHFNDVNLISRGGPAFHTSQQSNVMLPFSVPTNANYLHHQSTVYPLQPQHPPPPHPPPLPPLPPQQPLPLIPTISSMISNHIYVSNGQFHQPENHVNLFITARDHQLNAIYAAAMRPNHHFSSQSQPQISLNQCLISNCAGQMQSIQPVFMDQQMRAQCYRQHDFQSSPYNAVDMVQAANVNTVAVPMSNVAFKQDSLRCELSSSNNYSMKATTKKGKRIENTTDHPSMASYKTKSSHDHGSISSLESSAEQCAYHCKDIKRSISTTTVITISSGEDDDMDAKGTAHKRSTVIEPKVRRGSVNKNDL